MIAMMKRLLNHIITNYVIEINIISLTTCFYNPAHVHEIQVVIANEMTK